MPNSLILVAIIGCEVGFWVFVAAGLILRYRWRKPRLSMAALLMVVVLDILLLVAVGFDLHSGADVSTVHLLAGIYLGGSIAFGHRMIGWADDRFAYHFADGPKPAKPPKSGRSAIRYEWRLFFLWLLAAALALAANGLLATTVADAAQRADLLEIVMPLGLITVIWLASGPVWAVGRTVVDRVNHRR